MGPSRACWLAAILLLAPGGFAATDVRTSFILNTSDANGAPLQENRFYYVYRPDGLPRTAPLPMVLVMDNNAAAFLHRKAGAAGFLVVSCYFSGNSTGDPGSVWTSEDPRVNGFEDFDYTTAVIERVRAAENAGEVFISGLSKGGHMALAYAAERPDMIRAAASLDEFMQLTSNIPSAPVPVIVFEGTADNAVPYTMVKDTVDAWRAVDGLLGALAVTGNEAAGLIPGSVSQATWRGGTGGAQVAFVTIIGGTHTYPTPAVQTGYDYTEGMWAFFSQFLTAASAAPRVVSQPVSNFQPAGQSASFRVTGAGSPPLSYQWQRNGVDIPGATANLLTVTASPDANGASFRAVITNALGTVTSDGATLTVTAPTAGPSLASGPADRTVMAGQSVTFTGTAGPGPAPSYQWRKNGIDIPGAASSSYTIPVATTADSGASFTLVSTGAAGNAISARATLNVTPAGGAPILLSNPARARILAGQTADFSVAAWGRSPLSYQWQKQTFTGNMIDIPGATAAIYTTPAATLADHLTLFRCIVSNAAGSVASAAEMLFVTGAPVPPSGITSEIAVTAQAGAPFHYSIVSSGGTSPVVYSAAPLPAGLRLDAATGVISGAPASPGNYPIAITAANAAGSFSRVLNVTVTLRPARPAPREWRLAHFGASVFDPSISGDSADPDGDGYTNLQEYTFGSDPLDPMSVPHRLRRGRR